MILLNLGSGGKPLPDYINVDHEPSENPDVVCDLGTARWPWDDNSVDGANASHVLEHLPGDTFFHFLKELYRVCKPGALVKICLPHPRHDIFLNDPTHYRPVTPGTMVMFSNRYVETMAERGLFLTNFARRCGVDFELQPKILYKFDQSVDTENIAPEVLNEMARTQNNIVMEWHGTLKVIK